MHMADALLAPGVATTMYVCSGVAAACAVRKVRASEDTSKVPLMGVMGAFVFAAQMINFTIPGTGSSGHLCGGMLLAGLLGPSAAFLTMIGILLIQCLLFADGGVLALGANIWNMAFYGCFLGGGIIWRGILKNGFSRKKIILASILGSVITLQLGAFSVCLQTLASGITELPFRVFVGAMLPIHLAIGLVEGLITAAVLLFVYEARPELLDGYAAEQTGKRALSARGVVAILLAAACVIGGLLSQVASEHPDGLEWSVARVTGKEETETPDGQVYAKAEAFQEKTALLPDYTFKDVGEEDTRKAAWGTTVSGVAGGLLVMVCCAAGCYGLKRLKRRPAVAHG
ncbi:MAG: energy-coupling factor ABC transporter permease [Kiritimatiellae bacterium]|nr:energy-coupling factor ABC transporter permease [Kiritimatiellia bacterium]